MHVYLRGDSLQRLRLGSGLVLFAFAATHFLNHALGLLGLELMHQAQALRTSITRSWPGTIVLGSALATHIAIGLHKLIRRNTWRMPRWEAVQIALGLAIPFLLFPHIINTRISHVFFNVNDSYLYELTRLWPERAFLQSLLLLIVWTHGCMGLHFWLRLLDGYWRWAPALLVVAVGLPTLALAGFAVTGHTTSAIMSDAQALQALKTRSHWPNAADSNTLAWLRDSSQIAFAVLLVTVAGVQLARYHRRTLQAKAARISYVGGPTIDLKRGMTLLEASRSAGVRHASVCGGRARCSTCRVRIERGLDTLPPPTGAEAITLKSIDAPANVRLACQVMPSSSLSVAIISKPRSIGPIETEFGEIKEGVAAHVRAMLARQIVDVASSSPAELVHWFNDKVTYAVAVHDLQHKGFPLVGARIDYLFNRPVAAVVYMCREHAVTLFILPKSKSGTLAIRGTRNGYHMLAWDGATLAYIAVSDVPLHDLEALEAGLLSTGADTTIDAAAGLELGIGAGNGRQGDRS
jgi:adenylate cyclase